jgi:hypothetical protein
MTNLAVPSPGKRCRCGARRDKAARQCAKCCARLRYRRARHYRESGQRRADRFTPHRNPRKDMPS